MSTWQAIPMRWALVRAGDVVLDPDGNPWMVCGIDNTRGHHRIGLRRAEKIIYDPRDPNQTVRVLVPTADAAAVVTLREQLGPVRVLDRA